MDCFGNHYAQFEIDRTDTGYFPSCNHQERLPYQILGDQNVMNVQIDPPTTEIWSKS